MVTGQTAQTNQINEYLTEHILTPRNPPSHQYQNLSTQVSQDNNLPIVEQTPRNQNSDANEPNIVFIQKIVLIQQLKSSQGAREDFFFFWLKK